MGTVNRAAPVIRECYRQAIIKNATAIIACHNHPSGDTTPSPEDKQFTRELADAGKILGVRLLDHIILGDNFYSFADSMTLRVGGAE
jgi:DNA repair protein RadC